MTRVYLADIRARAGDLAAAEALVRDALVLLADSPAYRALALARLARLQLAAGGAEVEQGLATAREAQGVLDALGGLADGGEALVRLAFAEALVAADRPDEARVAIATAREQLLSRAARITDPARRQSFLEQVLENAETLRLARVWLGDAGAE